MTRPPRTRFGIRPPSPRAALFFAAAAALIAGLYLAGLGSYPLANATESLYAEIAREMLQAHHFIVPRLDGAVYLQKPPLLYWLTTVSFAVLGTSTFSARLVAALAALATIWLLWRATRPFAGRAAAYAAVVLATSVGFLLTAHVFFFASLLTLCTTAALLAGYRWYETGSRRALRAAAAALALGVMTKGLVALAIVGLPGLGLLLTGGRRGRWRALLDPWAIALFLAIAAPWYVLGTLRVPGFVHDVLWNEQFARFFGTRVPDDYEHGPIYYYLPILVGYLLPWMAVVPMLAWPPAPRLQRRRRRLARFAWLWLLSNLAFFSLSADKGTYYLVPTLPAAALLLGLHLHARQGDRERRRRLFLLVPLTVPVLLIAVVAYARRHALALPQAHLLLAGAVAAMAALALAATLLGWRGRTRAGALAAGGMLAPFLGLLIVTYHANAGPFSAAPAARLIRSLAPADPRVVAYGKYDPVSALPFYLHQKISVLGYHGKEFAYASSHAGSRGPAKPFIGQAALLADVRSGPTVVVMPASRDHHFERVCRAAAGLRYVRTVDGYALFSNVPGALAQATGP